MKMQSVVSNIIQPEQQRATLVAVEPPTFRLTRKLTRESKPLGKLTALGAILLLVSGLCYLGFLGYRGLAQNQRWHEAQRQQIARLEAEVLRVNQQLDQLASLESTVAQNNQQLGALAESNRRILAAHALPTTLWSAYSRGVCLISGSYVFIDAKTGLPLRRRERKQAEADPSLPLGQVRVTTEGAGELAEVVYEGTGFHVGDGYILTNRHIVVEPWEYDSFSQLFSTLNNAQPRMRRLVAYFPGQRRAYALNFKRAAPHADIAVCKLGGAELPPALPVLPLDRKAGTVKVGEAVLMIGYPAGTDRLLAPLPEEEVERLHAQYGESPAALLRPLAQRDLVKPLATQGHVMNLVRGQIAYNAASGEGGSGAPVFGPSGRVVGIHYGAFQRDRISSYAVPIERSFPLLQQAGWQPAK